MPLLSYYYFVLLYHLYCFIFVVLPFLFLYYAVCYSSPLQDVPFQGPTSLTGFNSFSDPPAEVDSIDIVSGAQDVVTLTTAVIVTNPSTISASMGRVTLELWTDDSGGPQNSVKVGGLSRMVSYGRQLCSVIYFPRHLFPSYTIQMCLTSVIYVFPRPLFSSFTFVNIL
jgi:hypothetical protein